MAITIDAYTVVAKKDRVAEALESGRIDAGGLADDDLWKCSFMALEDARSLIEQFEQLGLNTTVGPDSDVVVVNEFDQSIEPYCEWLVMAQWDNAWIAWLEGTQPKTVIAHEGWDPAKGSGVQFSDGTKLEFLRREGEVEVYLNKSTGKEAYINRPQPSLDALFYPASRVITEHMRVAGQASLVGEPAEAVAEAVESMAKVCERSDISWRPWWLLGKGQLSLGRFAQAYESFRVAYELEPQESVIPREWTGVCLELQRFDEAVEIGMKGCLA